MFGGINAVNLRSSLTLFIEAGARAFFTAALDRWFEGRKDETTLPLLAEA